MISRSYRWPDPPLATERFTLRPWRVDDAEALVTAWHDPAIVAMGSVPPTAGRDYATTWIGSINRRLEAGVALDLVIADDSDAVVGEVGVSFVPPRSDQGEIGYWVGADYRGQRFATEAVGVFVAWLLAPEGLGLGRVAARVQPSNAGSIRVLDHAGFVLAASGPGPDRLYVCEGNENLSR